MKRLITIIGIAMLLYGCSKDSNYIINYTISPIFENDEQFLKIKLDFQGNGADESILLFQDKAWGQDSLHNSIHNLKLLSEKGEVIPSRDSNWFQIKHPKDSKLIEIEYLIKQEKTGDLTTWDTYRPIVESNYFHIFSHNFFMLPKHIIDESDDNFDVVIKWKDFPSEYKIANSFGSNQQIQTIKNTSEEKFHTAVFVGGDFRIHEIDVKGNKVAFIIRGDWEVLKDSTMIEILEKTVTVQRDFWQDHTQDYFAVTMIPTVQEKGSGFQGSGLTNSFATNATNNEYLEIEGLVYLFNHELQHNWIGHVINNDDEEKQYWFSEGFTDYYTLKNIANENIYGLDKSYFINELNGFIRSLFTNPVRELPNSEMTYDNFWSGKEGMQKLPYRRGALLAFYLDQKIRLDTKGKKCLDDLMLAIKHDAMNSDQKISHDYFIDKANTFLKEDFAPFFNKHIEEGQLYDLEFIFKEFGFDYHPTSKVFDLGFTFSEDRKQIAAVDKNSKAYELGVRTGDLVKMMSYYYDSLEYEAEFILIRDGKENHIKYLPVREARIPQLIDNEENKEILKF